ncbi:hypothetical protein VTP01DRAFT_1407 [Rhizomucor pusillus]|uniref:uncharacterized protein n=1 Tax=Rhizomucor pusillus TaxID=4840 RepID=UPI003743FE88
MTGVLPYNVARAYEETTMVSVIREKRTSVENMDKQNHTRKRHCSTSTDNYLSMAQTSRIQEANKVLTAPNGSTKMKH